MTLHGNADLAEDFLSSVFGQGATTGGIVIQIGDNDPVETRDVEIIREAVEGPDSVGVSLVTSVDGVDWEIVGIHTQFEADEDPSRVLKPSLTLVRDDTRYAVWLLEEPVSLDGAGSSCPRIDAINMLLNGMDGSPDDARSTLGDLIPLPGIAGWLVDATGLRYSLEALEQAFSSSTPTKTHFDARVHGDPAEEILEREIEFGIGPKGADTKKWKNRPMKIGALINLLAKHDVGPKDGSALLQGAVIGGERKAQSMLHMDLLILDLDTGESIEDAVSRIKELGLLAVVYSTHSHMKPVSPVLKDRFLKWSDNAEPTATLVARYLQEEKRYQPDILTDVTLLETQHTKDGIMLRLQHRPMPKFRVVLFLKDRFVFMNRRGSPRDVLQEWKERYAGVARHLNATFDRSCVDPSRLMYMPRHAEGSAYRIDIIAGDLLDLDSIERVNIKDAGKETNAFEQAASDMGVRGNEIEAKTPGLKKFFAKYGTRFEIVDFLEAYDPTGDRGDRGGKPGKHWRCPNDAAHTNAGDSEDRAFFCVNASDSDTGAVAKCMHDSCAELDRMAFVDLVCLEHNLGTDMLREHLVEVVGEDEEDEPAPRQKLTALSSSREAEAMIQALTKGDSDQTDQIAKALGQSNKISPTQKAKLIDQLAKKSGFGKSTLKTAMRKTAADDELEGAYDSEDVVKACNDFNKKYAFALMGGNKGKILQEPKRLGDFPTFLDVETWTLLEKPRRVPRLDAAGNARVEPVSKLWLEWDKRRTYRGGVVFEPEGAQNDCYNMWRGYPVQGSSGDWTLLKSHILDNVCRGNPDHYEWFMTWVAQMFQQPGIKLGSSVTIRGKKGTGKTKLFEWISKAMGRHAVTVSHSSHIVGKFNSLHLGTILMVCEEAFWAGSPEAGGVLKNLITSPWSIIENKGIDAYQVSNYMRLAMISNEDWVVPAGLEDERRFFVLEISDQHRGDLEYFAAIDQQMSNGGLDAMVHELMHWTPANNDWNVLRTPPHTEEMIVQALEGLQPWDRFFQRILTDGSTDDIPNMDVAGFDLNVSKPTEIPVKQLRAHYDQFLKNSSNGRFKLGNDRFMKACAERWLLIDAESKTVRLPTGVAKCYVVPPLQEILDHHKNCGVHL